ncbi:MAG: hypothetical protein JST59_07425 [Actinobacteria bacterium]|nr:hypothetical protein [Actinomycetota bacterium]
MKTPHLQARRISGLLALAIGVAALLALPGIAVAKHHHRDHPHGRHHARASQAHLTSVEETSTITSFDPTTGKLTIALKGGESITGLVTEETEIKCEGNAQSLDNGNQQGDDDGETSGGHDEGSEDGSGEGSEDGQGEPGDGAGGDQGDDGWDSGQLPEEPPTTGEGGSCTTAALTPGSIVGGAELRLEGGAAVFREIELGFHS